MNKTVLVMSGLTLLVVAACSGQLGLPTQTPAAAALSGEVSLPVGLLDPSHVIPTGIGAVIPAGAGNVIAAGGGNVIAAGAGNVIAAGAGNYRVLDVTPDQELPVSGAHVAALDPSTLARLPGVPDAQTDGTGHFQLTGVPAGSLVVLEAAFLSPDNKYAYRLLELARAGQSGDAPVSYASTLVVEALVQQAATKPGTVDWTTFDPTALAPAEAAVRQAFKSMPADQGFNELATAIDVEPQALASGTALPGTLIAPSPSLPPLPALSATGTVLPGAVSSAVGGVLSSTAPLTNTLTGTLASTASSDTSTALPGALASTASSIVSSTVPGALSSTSGVLSSTVPGALASTVAIVSSAPTNVVTSSVPSTLSSTVSQVTGSLLPSPTSSSLLHL
ncbi:MAG TPA: hypothetical protein V6D47_11025 [Oscillatoriaceae cyanobacterium]